MATEYGGARGDQPWQGAQPPYADQLAAGPPPGGGPSGRQRWPRTSSLIAVTALVLGVAGLVVSLAGVAAELLPRRFTAGQQRQITNWEAGKLWRELPAGTIFPALGSYPPPAALNGETSLTLSARRIGIAKQATCDAATDAAAAAVLERGGCADVLRATYADSTGSYVITVGVAVLPGVAQASAANASLAGAGDAGGLAPGVRAVAFSRTPAGWFTDQRRQLSGSIAAGTYVVLYTAGYADSRPRVPIASDAYGDAEMEDAAAGVASLVKSELAVPLPSPRCPGTPGC